MRFERRDLRWVLLLSIFYVLLLPPLVPHALSHPFVPFVVVALFTMPFDRLLALSLVGGFLNDLMISEIPFGLLPLLYMGCAYLLHRYKQLIGQDSFVSLALFTALFSLMLNLGELFYFRGGFRVLFEREFLLQPFQDGLWTLVLYSLPYYFFHQKRRRSPQSIFSYKKR